MKKSKKIKPIKCEWRYIETTLLNNKLNEIIKVVNELTSEKIKVEKEGD